MKKVPWLITTGSSNTYERNLGSFESPQFGDEFEFVYYRFGSGTAAHLRRKESFSKRDQAGMC